MKRWLIIMILLLAGGSLAAITKLSASLSEARREASVARANVAALQDTIHRYQGDSTAAVSLMAFQDSVSQDSISALGEALGAALRDRRQTAVVVSRLSVELDAVRDTLVSTRQADDPLPEEGEDRTEEFVLEGPPIQGTMTVTAPWERAAPWRMNTNLMVSPMDLVYLVGCDAQRNAIVNVQGPGWARLNLERGTVDPDVCHPVSRSSLLSWDVTVGGMAWGTLLGGGAVLLIQHFFGGDDSSYDEGWDPNYGRR